MDCVSGDIFSALDIDTALIRTISECLSAQLCVSLVGLIMNPASTRSNGDEMGILETPISPDPQESTTNSYFGCKLLAALGEDDN